MLPNLCATKELDIAALIDLTAGGSSEKELNKDKKEQSDKFRHEGNKESTG